MAKKKMNNKVKAVILSSLIAAITLFLALRYNDFVSKLFAMFLPETSSLWIEGVILFILTVIVVYLIIMLQKTLGGK